MSSYSSSGRPLANPIVSVVVPTYQYAYYIKHCRIGILKQQARTAAGDVQQLTCSLWGRLIRDGRYATR